MFTGIVQGTGIISWLEASRQFAQIGIQFPENLLIHLKIGASVSVDGVCLTVVRQENARVYFDIVAETLNCTTLRYLTLNQTVNLERALKIGDEMGGHQLSGHVIGTAQLSEIETPSPLQRKFHFNCPTEWSDYLFPKGFVAINGVSLTLVDSTPGQFSVHLIPETLRLTNLGSLQVSDTVNIEIDYQTQAIVQTVKRYLNQAES